MKIERIHHVAYRCANAKKTVLWYKKFMNMDFILAIAENKVPSTKEKDPYMHIFLDAGAGNVLAFFELPNSKPATKVTDPNTPVWCQHIAFKIGTMEEMYETKKKWEDGGLEVVGPTNHGLFMALYTYDPDGNRLELSVDIGTPEERAEGLAKMDKVKWEMLDYFDEYQKIPEHAAWIHEVEFSK